MSRAFKRTSVHAWVTAVIVVISGCATQLAPAYDKLVVDGLAIATTDVMTLLAKADQGTSGSTFAGREDHYNTLIGKFDSLAIQAGSRPVPKSRAPDSINRVLEKRGVPPMQDDDATPPSAHSASKVVTTLTTMRNKDRQAGLTALEVRLFRNQIVTYLDQAVTYENFLQR
jgi:hypothetical protein